jgi:hypothetical protein
MILAKGYFAALAEETTGPRSLLGVTFICRCPVARLALGKRCAVCMFMWVVAEKTQTLFFRTTIRMCR